MNVISIVTVCKYLRLNYNLPGSESRHRKKNAHGLGAYFGVGNIRMEKRRQRVRRRKIKPK